METPAEMPARQFLTWQPGKLTSAFPEGLSSRLEPGNDIVLQTHLNPSGNPEVFPQNENALKLLSSAYHLKKGLRFRELYEHRL